MLEWFRDYLKYRPVNEDQSRTSSQCRHSMANIKIHQSHIWHFALALTISDILTFQMFYLGESRSRLRSTTLAMLPFDGKYQKLSNSYFAFFSANSSRFVDITVQMFDLVKVGQGREEQRSQWCHSIANIKIYNRHFFLHF